MKNFPEGHFDRFGTLSYTKALPEKNLRILFSEHTQQSGVYGSGDFAWHQLKQ